MKGRRFASLDLTHEDSQIWDRILLNITDESKGEYARVFADSIIADSIDGELMFRAQEWRKELPDHDPVHGGRQLWLWSWEGELVWVGGARN